MHWEIGKVDFFSSSARLKKANKTHPSTFVPPLQTTCCRSPWNKELGAWEPLCKGFIFLILFRRLEVAFSAAITFFFPFPVFFLKAFLRLFHPPPFFPLLFFFPPRGVRELAGGLSWAKKRLSALPSLFFLPFSALRRGGGGVGVARPPGPARSAERWRGGGGRDALFGPAGRVGES